MHNDDPQQLDALAAEAKLNLHLPVTERSCLGCAAPLVAESVGPHGYPQRDYACGHRYTQFSRTTHIGKISVSIKNPANQEGRV
jgi:hypothetical protein